MSLSHTFNIPTLIVLNHALTGKGEIWVEVSDNMHRLIDGEISDLHVYFVYLE